MSETLTITSVTGLTVIGLIVAGALGMNEARKLPPPPNSASSRTGQALGGMETPNDWLEYIKCDVFKYCDKGGHKERSRFNDSGEHNKFWNKKGKQ